MTQLGNVGGAPYWSWYGFNSRVEWCACFVSWCADHCGYIESGIIPNFLAAWTAQIGLRVTDNGKTEITSRGQAILFSLIGKATEKPTM